MSTTDLTLRHDLPTAPSLRTAGDILAGCYALSRRLDSEDDQEVWLAYDEVIGRDVSLHFVPDVVRKDTRALQELRVDIKRNRQLIHPNILRIYDLVEEPEWVAISMDVCEGESFAQRIKTQAGKSDDRAEIQRLVVQLANILEEAHKINVLHRGLAPENLFLTKEGKLQVANFGIAHTLREAKIRAGMERVPGIAYQSPQLLEGKPPARTDDIYSVGAILFALLTGGAPFTGEDIAQQVRAGISPESAAVLSKEEFGIPEKWRKLIAACLDMNPDARPKSAVEVARRLAESEIGPASVPQSIEAAGAEAGPAQVPPAVPLQLAKSTPEPVQATPEPVKATPEPVKATPEPVQATPEPVKATPEPVKATPEPVKVAPEPAKSPLEPVKATTESPTGPATPKTFGSSGSEHKKGSENAKPASGGTPPKSPERPFPKDFTPHQYPEESRLPVMGIAAAVIVIALIAIVYYFVSSGKRSSPTVAVEQGPEQAELRSLSQPTPPPAPVAPSTGGETSPPQPQTPAPAASVETGISKAIADKATVLEKARMNAQAAEKTHADLLKKQAATEAGLAEALKEIDEKTKAMEPLKKAADEFAVQKKKMEEEQKATELAAAEAQKMAAEKMRQAEESARILAEFGSKNSAKIVAQQQAEAELATLQKTLEEKQRIVAENTKALVEAEGVKQQQLAIVTEHEREVERIKSMDLEAQRQKEAAQAERAKLDRELAEMQRMFKAKMEELENRRKELEQTPSLPTEPKAWATPAPANPAPATPTIVTPVATPPAVAASKMATPSPAIPEPLRMASIPSATPSVLPTATPAPTGGTGGNSLGMKFAPVGEVDFCIWLTRVKDFEVFAKAVNLKSLSWKGPGFKQSPEHPVVNVSWQEAIAFCKWLTDKEHKEQILPANHFYRLPTDLEWSKAVGLPMEGGRTPEMRDMGVPDVYPWGNQWPPPAGAGNYTGEETGSDVAIKGYDDGFAWTAPVGSFPPNKFGLYDMGGNVWQWCMDTWNAESKAKVLRGASWYNGALKLSLLSSCRVHAAPDSSTDNYGFRIVRVKEESKSGKK